MGMAQEKTSTWGMFTREIFQSGLYKRSQGKLVRQATFGGLAAGVCLGCYSLSNYLVSWPAMWRFGLPFAVLLAAGWLCYRLVNVPQFADFLIAVEAELSKVTWPTRGGMFRSALVVIFTIVAMSLLLFLYDTVWRAFLHALGVMG
ncbi:MAG: preprotein translocase subunit SecE [Pirellulales bacterium]|nr:preprotein translocase subunit SecE [Pirellulales bacterium]